MEKRKGKVLYIYINSSRKPTKRRKVERNRKLPNKSYPNNDCGLSKLLTNMVHA